MQMHSVFMKEIERLRRLLIGMGINQNDGEDILQDVYLEILRKPPKSGSMEEKAGWLMRVTINKSLLKFRQKRQYNRTENLISQQFDEQKILQPAPENNAIQNEEELAMRNCLNEMDESLKAPLVMKYFCGLNSSQISEILELKPGTVRKRLYQGRVILAEMLSEKGIKR